MTTFHLYLVYIVFLLYFNLLFLSSSTLMSWVKLDVSWWNDPQTIKSWGTRRRKTKLWKFWSFFEAETKYPCKELQRQEEGQSRCWALFDPGLGLEGKHKPGSSFVNCHSCFPTGVMQQNLHKPALPSYRWYRVTTTPYTSSTSPSAYLISPQQKTPPLSQPFVKKRSTQ